jgi:hypothetical protein
MLLEPEPGKQPLSGMARCAIAAAAVLVLLTGVVSYNARRGAREHVFETAMDAYRSRAWCSAVTHCERLFALEGAAALKARARSACEESQFMCKLGGCASAYAAREAECTMRLLVTEPGSRFRAMAEKKWLDALDVTTRPFLSLEQVQLSLRQLATCARLGVAAAGALPVRETDADRELVQDILRLRSEDPGLFHSMTSSARELHRKAIQWLATDTGAAGQDALYELAQAACSQKPSPGWLAPVVSVAGKRKLLFSWDPSPISPIKHYSYQDRPLAELQATSLGEVRLVACGVFRSVTLEVCRYAICFCSVGRHSSNCRIYRKANVLDVSLHDPISGALVAKRQFRGSPPRQCKEYESFEHPLIAGCGPEESLHGEAPSWARVATWFSQLSGASKAP